MAFKKLFNLFRGKSPTTSAEKTNHHPIEPYEYLLDDEPLLGVRLFRPLVYCFEHVILVEAFFTGHPELQNCLQSNITQGKAFRHFWAKSAVSCDARGWWPANVIDNDDSCFAYLQTLEESLICTPLNHAAYDVWILQTPEPIGDNETYYIALCEPQMNDNHTVLNKRYITLEVGHYPDKAFLCEWDYNGKHHNHGTITLSDDLDFKSLVIHILKPKDGQ